MLFGAFANARQISRIRHLSLIYSYSLILNIGPNLSAKIHILPNSLGYIDALLLGLTLSLLNAVDILLFFILQYNIHPLIPIDGYLGS